jgi:murein DD-endopeptidase MepM/ murein hydrolase activator NlpD
MRPELILMSDEPYPEEFSQTGDRTAQNSQDGLSETDPVSKSRLLALWDSLSQAGMAEAALRLGTHVLLIALVLVIGWIMRQFYSSAQVSPVTSQSEAALAAALPTPTPAEASPELPAFTIIDTSTGIMRTVMLTTTLPTRPREEVILYTVEQGDTLFGIAEKFGLKPETLLWGNQLVLGDNPHNLRPGQELNILPVNGTYYRWAAGDGLNGVAKFFGVDPEDIINYPGNHLDPEQIGDFADPNIEPGTWLIIPGGTREFVTWSAPVIPRDNPGVAKVLGPGACGSVVDGAVGVGSFIWPANNHFLSGFDYSPSTNHSGIDIDGNTGDPIYAADNGVVVYAGWNNWGYGNVVVINHGNGWQTLYAHLDTYNVGCGQSVFQGNVVGAMGNTGNSSGSHLHYEMMYNGTKVNPWDYLP